MANAVVETGVIDGAVITQSSPTGMKIDVSASDYVIDDVVWITTGGTNMTVAAADATYPRWDLVYGDTSGNTTIQTGIAQAPDSFGQVPWPARDYTKCLFGAYYVPAGVTSIIDDYIDNSVKTIVTDMDAHFASVNVTLSSKLAADVTMTSANTFYDAVGLSSVGDNGETWMFLAAVEILGGGIGQITGKLWNGTTVWAEGSAAGSTTAANQIFLATVLNLTAPINPKISCASTVAGGTIKANPTANSAGSNTATILIATRIK